MTEWRKWCNAGDLYLEGSNVDVELGGERERRHRVHVDEDADALSLTAVVVGKAVATAHPGLALRAWVRNRSTFLVGFRLDHRGRLVAEAWIPKVGTTAEEFGIYVRAVAAEADRLEYLITGGDDR